MKKREVKTTSHVLALLDIKHKRNDKSGISTLKQNGKLETEPKRQADILNDQFKSVFSNSDPVAETEFDQNRYMNCSIDTHYST